MPSSGICSINVEWGDGKQHRSGKFLWWLWWGANCILAFSIFCDTSGVTNRINKCLIALKWNSSGFNRILITAYRCLLVTLNYHAFPLFASFFLFSVVCTYKMVSVVHGWITPFISYSLDYLLYPSVFYAIKTLFYGGLVRPWMYVLQNIVH